jgi:hypothetical protein
MSSTEPLTEGFEQPGTRPPAPPTSAGPQLSPQEISPPAQGRDVLVIDEGEYAGRGFETVTTADLITPFIGIIQSNSPELVPESPKYLPDAKPGMLINTATRMLYTALEGVMVFDEHCFTKWIPRDEGGGFRGVLPPDDELVRKLFRPGEIGRKGTGDEEGTELIEQFNLWGYFGESPINLATAFQGVLAFTSTKIPVRKGFLSQATSVKVQSKTGLVPAALWTLRWRISTRYQENPKGKFYNYAIALAGGDVANSRTSLHDPDLYKAAVELNTTLQKRDVREQRANYAAQESSTVLPDDNVPF